MQFWKTCIGIGYTCRPDDAKDQLIAARMGARRLLCKTRGTNLLNAIQWQALHKAATNTFNRVSQR